MPRTRNGLSTKPWNVKRWIRNDKTPIPAQFRISTTPLTLPVSLHRLTVSLPVVLRIVRMTGPPFLLAILADLVIPDIGVKLATVTLPPALPPRSRSTAEKLVRMVTEELKELLAVAAVASAHQAAPGRDSCHPL
jgi:hypothetical protein